MNAQHELRPRASKLLDEIKDEVDRLHEIRSTQQRVLAARDLIEYVELHHLDGLVRR